MLRICLLASAAIVTLGSLWPSPPPSPDYVALARAYLAGTDAVWTPEFSDKCSHSRGIPVICDGAASLSAAHAAFWQYSGNTSDLNIASSLLLTFVHSYRNATANGTMPDSDATNFFACAPPARAALTLVQGGALAHWPPEDLIMLRDHALLSVCSPQMRGTWNQAVSLLAR